MDPTNPCFAMQYRKLGANPGIRTQNRIPIRQAHVTNRVQWSSIFPRWIQLEEECLKLNQQLNQHSRFVICLGEENYSSFCKLFQDNHSWELEICTLLPGIMLFNRPSEFCIVRQKETGSISQVIWFSCHLQHFFYLYQDTIFRHFHDFLWNGVAELAGIDVINPCVQDLRPGVTPV